MAVKLDKIYLANLFTAGSALDLKCYIRLGLAERVFSLESFWNLGRVKLLLKRNPKVKFFLDSGAHSLLHHTMSHTVPYEVFEGADGKEKVFMKSESMEVLDRNSRIAVSEYSTGSKNLCSPIEKSGAQKTGVLKKFPSAAFTETQDIKDYLSKYITFIHEHIDNLYAYVNLDIIYNGPQSWTHQKEMEKQGLNPIPVYHFGEDRKWLTKYMDDYEYIGIGGLGQDNTKQRFIREWGDPLWKYMLESNQEIKVHGFAVNAFDLLKRYPWWSVDATSWVKAAAYGKVFVPGFNSQTGKIDFNRAPSIVKVSTRVSAKGETHWKKKYTKHEREMISNYFKSIRVCEVAMEDNLFYRCLANIRYFQGYMEYANDVEFLHLVMKRRELF